MEVFERRGSIAMTESDWSPTWQPTAEERQKLLRFEGYGPDKPDVLFVGLEEACSDEEQRKNIYIRCKDRRFQDTRGDKNEAMEALEGAVNADVRVWKIMADVMVLLSDRKTTFKAEYEALGTRRPRSSGLSTFLMELRPLPRPRRCAFKETYIAEWFRDEFHSASDYDRVSIRGARERLSSLLSNPGCPRYLFAYGKETCCEVLAITGPTLRSGPKLFANDSVRVAVTSSGRIVVLTGFYGGRGTFHRKDVAGLDPALEWAREQSAWHGEGASKESKEAAPHESD
jgi:hypothetical protein